ncbi:hypothetical protein COO60DRAFT_1541116, partial [Scenedesmus sp. NREL 46B-D3]
MEAAYACVLLQFVWLHNVLLWLLAFYFDQLGNQAATCSTVHCNVAMGDFPLLCHPGALALAGGAWGCSSVSLCRSLLRGPGPYQQNSCCHLQSSGSTCCSVWRILSFHIGKLVLGVAQVSWRAGLRYCVSCAHEVFWGLSCTCNAAVLAGWLVLGP